MQSHCTAWLLWAMSNAEGAWSQLISGWPKATVNVTALRSSCFPTLIHLIWQRDANEISLTGRPTYRIAGLESGCWGRCLKLLGKCKSNRVFQNIPQSPASRGGSRKCVYYAGTWLLNWDFMATSADRTCNKLPSLISNKYVSWHCFAMPPMNQVYPDFEDLENQTVDKNWFTV